jgi:hypothetical protein
MRKVDILNGVNLDNDWEAPINVFANISAN